MNKAKLNILYDFYNIIFIESQEILFDYTINCKLKKQQMKKIFLLVTVIVFSTSVFAQKTEENEEKPTGFQKDKLFTGGDLTLAFYTGGTTLGVSPYLGYSVTTWLDAAVSLNFVYHGQKDYSGIKYRQTNIGPGAFVRIFPIDFLYLQAQYEHNFINLKVIEPGVGTVSKGKTDVNSVLLGAGYSSGRSAGNNSYFYLSVMFDVAQLPNSPYIDSHRRMIPIIRAGYNIGLFQGRQRRERY